MAAIDVPFLHGDWRPAEPVDLSRPTPRPAVTTAVAASWPARLDAARAALRAAEDEQAWIDLASDLHGAPDPAQAARAAIVAAHRQQFGV